MTATNEEITIIVTTLAGVYGSKDVSPMGYIWALEDLDIESIQAAARGIVKSSKWMPKPAELREAAEKIQVSSRAGSEYWRAMTMFNDSLAGRMTQEAAELDPALKWFRKQSQPPAPNAAAWEKTLGQTWDGQQWK